MRKTLTIAVLFVIAIVFTTGCSAKRDRFYQQKIMTLEAQLAKAEKKDSTEKTDKPVMAGEDKHVTNDGAVADDQKKGKKPGAKKIPVAAMKNGKKEQSSPKAKVAKEKTVPKKNSSKKVLSWTDRIKILEAKVTRHDEQIACNTRRLQRMEKIMNQMGTALRKVIEKAGGIENIKDVTIGPFDYNSSKVTDEMAAQIAVFCEEYKKAANGPQAGKKLFINIEAFTDQNGNPEYNKKLSQQRAEAAIPFFKKELAGIAFEISAKGAGETDEGFTDTNARVIKVTHEFKDITP